MTAQTETLPELRGPPHLAGHGAIPKPLHCPRRREDPRRGEARQRRRPLREAGRPLLARDGGRRPRAHPRELRAHPLLRSACSRSGSTSSSRRSRSATPRSTARTTASKAPSASARRASAGTRPIDEESWRYGHNVRHHGATNVAGKDADIHFGPIRLTKEVAPGPGGSRFQLPFALFVLFPNFGFLMNFHFTGVNDSHRGQRARVEARLPPRSLAREPEAARSTRRSASTCPTT